MIRRAIYPVTLCLCALLNGCALPHWSRAPADLAARPDIPAADPRFDQFSAWIPVSVAPTATAAQAMTRVALGKARLQAGLQLCGDILQLARITASTGPLRIEHGAPGESYWYYRVSQQPGLQDCATVSETEQYRFVRDHLPDWIQATPAMNGTRAVGLLESNQNQFHNTARSRP
jgi:hypothetical protein